MYIKLSTHVSLLFPVYHIMHAIITCTAPNLVGAGRQPLSAIHNLPDNYSKTIQIDSADNATGCLRVQVVEDTPVAMSPVPPTLKRVNTINRREGLAILERRKLISLKRKLMILSQSLVWLRHLPLSASGPSINWKDSECLNADAISLLNRNLDL
jgi:hypothetical protein